MNPSPNVKWCFKFILSKMRPMPLEKSQTRSFNEKVLLARGKQ